MKTKKLLIVPGNVYNLSLSARIAKEAEIQGLSTTPTVLTYFIEHLRKNDFDFNEIKWVYLGGEYCSKKMSELFRKTFPKAKLKFRFKSSEIGVMRGWRCLELDKEIDPNKFHPSKVSLTEVENEREKISTEGKSGNLLHTDLFIKAFPLIRYRTNDIGSLQNSKCKCGEEQLLLLGGRFNFDILRFQGVILRSTSIEKALEKVSNYLKPHYEMHVFEENIGGKIKPKLKLFVSMRENYKKNIENPLLIEEISRKISANLRLSAKSTLEDLVIKGYFLPLEISLVEKWKEDKQKSKKIISHLA